MGIFSWGSVAGIFKCFNSSQGLGFLHALDNENFLLEVVNQLQGGMGCQLWCWTFLCHFLRETQGGCLSMWLVSCIFLINKELFFSKSDGGQGNGGLHSSDVCRAPSFYLQRANSRTWVPAERMSSGHILFQILQRNYLGFKLCCYSTVFHDWHTEAWCLSL